MRALTPLQILSLGLPPPNYFIIDGTIVTGDPFETFRNGTFNHVPIMTGLVADEQAFFMPEIAGGPPRSVGTSVDGTRLCRLRSYLR